MADATRVLHRDSSARGDFGVQIWSKNWLKLNAQFA